MYRQEHTQLAIFKGLTPADMAVLESVMDLCTIPAHTTIFEQGQPADRLFILAKGEVTICFKPYDGPPLTVAHIQPGGVFGWSAALKRDTYSSAALTTTDCEAYCVSTEKLLALCDKNPELGTIILERLASVIAERLRSTHNQILAILSEGMDPKGHCQKKAEK
jgi:CRP/FNR family cyclic AMP-dependent transcriptional regulator